MGHMTYEQAIKRVYFGLYLLGAVTLIEVFFSLFGKGHVIGGIEDISWIGYIVGLILIVLSLYKAYFIIFEFMHMKYEVKGLALSVLLPTMLLVWAIIAFFQEGNSWKNRRELIKQKNEEPAKSPTQESRLDDDIYVPTFKG